MQSSPSVFRVSSRRAWSSWTRSATRERRTASSFSSATSTVSVEPRFSSFPSFAHDFVHVTESFLVRRRNLPAPAACWVSWVLRSRPLPGPDGHVGRGAYLLQRGDGQTGGQDHRCPSEVRPPTAVRPGACSSEGRTPRFVRRTLVVIVAFESFTRVSVGFWSCTWY